MDKIETLTKMIMELFKTVKAHTKAPYEGLTVHEISNPVKELHEDKLIEVLKKIESYGKLDDINVTGLDFLAVLDYKFPNYYDLLEFFYIPEVFLQEHSFEYFIIKYNILCYFTDLEDVNLIDLLDDYPGFDEIIRPYIELYKKIVNFKESIPNHRKARYGIQLEIMTEIMCLIYQSRYGDDYNQLFNIVDDWINDCDEKMSLNGINSWFYHHGEERRKIVAMLDNYIYDGLKGKKVIE
jgi:hypothetical protein